MLNLKTVCENERFIKMVSNDEIVRVQLNFFNVKSLYLQLFCLYVMGFVTKE